MALLTHKVSCADNYNSLFTKEKGIYGIPYLDKSRSSIPSDAGSFFERALSLRDSVQDLQLLSSRNIKTGSATKLEITAASQHVKTSASGVPAESTTLQTVHQTEPSVGEDVLDDYKEQDGDHKHHVESFSAVAEVINVTDDSSFVTANSDPASVSCAGEVIGTAAKNPYVFHRWMKTVIRKPTKKYKPRTHQDVEAVPSSSASSSSEVSSRRSSSSSDLSLDTIKTASTTLASFVADSNYTCCEKSGETDFDQATMERMADRKNALEELITTEEYYIRDLKSLRDQYLPILRDCVWISSDVRQTMARNVTEMLDLHGRLLADITRALPCTTQTVQDHAADAAPNVRKLQKCPILADPSAAVEVAKAFDAAIMAFFVYEEYSAKYQEVVKAPRRSGRPSETLREKGTEALIGASNSWDNRGEYGKRAMELYDMLCKPIQRLCKYPLLFRDIEKNTPAIDCPNANRLLEKVRHRLCDAVHQVNIANSGAPKLRERIGKTWLLQDRLEFHEKSLPVRLLGHVILCGTLHVAWQSNRESLPQTEYMACMLFKSYLILASVSKHDHYKVKFAVTLAVARVEEPGCGKGLYSPGAPHTWKIVFEADHCIYELLCSACSHEEEYIWRSHIEDRISVERTDYEEYRSTDLDPCSYTSSDIRPVGAVIGRPGTLARHQSLLRGGDMSSALESDGQYVVINNFLFANDPHGSPGTPGANYSALNFNGLVPTINLRRSERNRAESKLADVWTKDSIPFNATRSMQKETSSAMVMRGLSMLSMLSVGSKKSVRSHGSFSGHSDVPWEEDDCSQRTVKGSSTMSFATSAAESTFNSAPPSPTKRSSSLSSRFSLASTKESTQKKSSMVSKRRSMMLLIDGKWRHKAESEIEGAVSVESFSVANKPTGAVAQENGSSIRKASSSIDGEELDIHAALRSHELFMMAEQGKTSIESQGQEKPIAGEKIDLMGSVPTGRHTVVLPSMSRPNYWRNSKRKESKPPTEVTGGRATRKIINRPKVLVHTSVAAIAAHPINKAKGGLGL